jgi:hypothetical protein
VATLITNDQAPQQSTLGWLVRLEGLVGKIEAHQPTELVDEPQSNQPQWLIEKVGGGFETRVWEVILG